MCELLAFTGLNLLKIEKNNIIFVSCAIICNVCAQKKEVFSMPKLSGYAIGQYQYSGKYNSESNSLVYEWLDCLWTDVY